MKTELQGTLLVGKTTGLNLTGFSNVVLDPNIVPFSGWNKAFIHSFGKCGLSTYMMPANQRNPEAGRVPVYLALTIEWGGQRFIKGSHELIMLARCPQ